MPAAILILASWLPSAHGGGQTIYRGDNSSITPIDRSKTVEMKTFGGFDRSVQAHSVELKTANLPTYSGSFKSLPATEWKSYRPDFYAKAIPLKIFEVKSAAQTWSRDASVKNDLPVYKPGSDYSKRQINTTDSTVEQGDIPPPRQLSDAEAKELLNHGREAGKVEVGSGFSRKELGPSFKATPEMKPPPKSEPSR